ncbi:hypothetical protein Hamer_G000186 [Homarus americanus]|uniref:Uncharacterized protein n=1 Tax=Homarus americanus TaxID=6706 RepID=A0A8J5TT66_HOMAM|nr:hypothetical protein Hamer_G000186 [Homarus americanus]
MLLCAQQLCLAREPIPWAEYVDHTTTICKASQGWHLSPEAVASSGYCVPAISQGGVLSFSTILQCQQSSAKLASPLLLVVDLPPS